MVLVPDIATDIGTPNLDFTEWTYTIRDGVRFEDGTEVTAEDVAYGILRSFDRPAFNPAFGPTFSNDYFLNGDTYRGPFESGTDYDGVVVNGQTLTLKMARPFPEMPYWGAFPAMGPIPSGTRDDPAAYGRHPLATGPYKFADFTPGDSLTLVRNEEWDPDTDPGRHQYPDRYVFHLDVPYEEIAASVLGDSDRGQTTLSPGPGEADDYREAQSLGRLTTGSTPCTGFWAPDNRKIPEEVRRAIGYAYPHEAVANANGLTFGVTYLPATSILPLGFPGRQDYDVLDTVPGRPDPAKAAALLDEAGYAFGQVILRWPYIEDDPASMAAMDAIATALRAVGFTVRSVAVPATKWDAWNGDPEAPINVRAGSWCGDFPSGSSWFPPLFDSESDANRANFGEPEVDAEIKRISVLPIDEQSTAWSALDKTLMTDYYPVILTRYFGAVMLHGSRIGGMNNDSIFGMPTWKDVYVRG